MADFSARRARTPGGRAGTPSSLRISHTVASLSERSAQQQQQQQPFQSLPASDPLSFLGDDAPNFGSAAWQTPLRNVRQDADASLMATNDQMLLRAARDSPGTRDIPSDETPLNEKLAELVRESGASEWKRVEAMIDTLSATMQVVQSQLRREDKDRWTSAGLAGEALSRSIATMRHERNTWMLASTVTRLYVEDRSDHNSLAHLETSEFAPSEKTLLDLARKETLEMRQLNATVAWLGAVAALDRPDSEADRMGQANLGYSWINSKEAIETSKRRGPQQTPSTVAELDPDAPARTGRSLHPNDAAAELVLFERLFRLVRSNRVAEARALCSTVGQAWRAASLLGNEPHHYDTTSLEGRSSGCLHRQLWRRTALTMCTAPDMPTHERALYAAASAYLPTLLDPAICSTWNDALWAHALVLAQAKAEALAARTSRVQLAADLHEKAETSITHAFEAINRMPLPSVRDDAHHPIHQLQRLLLVNDTRGALSQMAQWASQASHAPYLRLYAHLVLFFRSVLPDEARSNDAPHHCETILRAYAQQLVNNADFACVATYTVHLQPHTHVPFYSEFAALSTERAPRQHALRLAEEVGIDVLAVATTVTSAAIERYERGRESDAVSAIDWLLFVPSHLPHAIFFVNRLLRRLLANDELEAARKAARKIVINEILIEGELPFNLDDVEEEFKSLTALLDAEEAFSSWSLHYAQRPDDARTEAHWLRVSQQNGLRADDALVRLLQYPGGWLCGLARPDDAAALQQLRTKFIPLALRQLHTVRHQGTRYREAVEVATLAASEQYHVAEVLRANPSALGELLESIRLSALKNVELKGNSIGR